MLDIANGLMRKQFEFLLELDSSRELCGALLASCDVCTYPRGTRLRSGSMCCTRCDCYSCTTLSKLMAATHQFTLPQLIERVCKRRR
jgi:hypothetical protein